MVLWLSANGANALASDCKRNVLIVSIALIGLFFGGCNSLKTASVEQLLIVSIFSFGGCQAWLTTPMSMLPWAHAEWDSVSYGFETSVRNSGEGVGIHRSSFWNAAISAWWKGIPTEAWNFRQRWVGLEPNSISYVGSGLSAACIPMRADELIDLDSWGHLYLRLPASQWELMNWLIWIIEGVRIWDCLRPNESWWTDWSG